MATLPVSAMVPTLTPPKARVPTRLMSPTLLSGRASSSTVYDTLHHPTRTNEHEYCHQKPKPWRHVQDTRGFRDGGFHIAGLIPVDNVVYSRPWRHLHCAGDTANGVWQHKKRLFRRSHLANLHRKIRAKVRITSALDIKTIRYKVAKLQKCDVRTFELTFLRLPYR